MGKQNMNELLKKRMASTKQASELAAGDEAYQKIFQEAPPTAPALVKEIPLDLLDPFTTADIGFKRKIRDSRGPQSRRCGKTGGMDKNRRRNSGC